MRLGLSERRRIGACRTVVEVVAREYPDSGCSNGGRNENQYASVCILKLEKFNPLQISKVYHPFDSSFIQTERTVPCPTAGEDIILGRDGCSLIVVAT